MKRTIIIVAIVITAGLISLAKIINEADSYNADQVLKADEQSADSLLTWTNASIKADSIIRYETKK